MRVIFVDAVAVLALLNTRDQWHVAAESVYQEIRTSQDRLITTTFVLLECGNAVARTSMRASIADFWARLERSKLVIRPTESDWQQAWIDYRRGMAGSASIVDHVSFQVMRRLGIQEAFTNDQHFTAAGFQVLF